MVVRALVAAASAADAKRRRCADLASANAEQATEIAVLRAKLARAAAAHTHTLTSIALEHADADGGAARIALDGALCDHVLHLESELAGARSALVAARREATLGAAKEMQRCAGAVSAVGDERGATLDARYNEIAMLWVEVGELNAAERAASMARITSSRARLCDETISGLHARRSELRRSLAAAEAQTARGGLLLGAAATTPKRVRGASLMQRWRTATAAMEANRTLVDRAHVRFLTTSAEIREVVERLDLDAPSEGAVRAVLCADGAYRSAYAAPLARCSRARVLAFLVRDDGAPPTFLQRGAMTALDAAHVQHAPAGFALFGGASVMTWGAGAQPESTLLRRRLRACTYVTRHVSFQLLQATCASQWSSNISHKVGS